MSEPMTAPRPPKRLVPPMTTAVRARRRAEGCAPADDDGGDALEVEVETGVGVGAVDAADLDPGRDADDRPGDHVGGEQHPVGADTGEPRGLRVVTCGIEMPA